MTHQGSPWLFFTLKVDPDHLATGFFIRFLCCKIFHTSLFGRTSLHAAHIWGLRSYAPPPQGTLVYRVWQHEGHEGLWQDLWKWRASLVAQMVKNPPAMWKTWVWSLGWEGPLEKGTAAHSNILAWRIPWTEEPGWVQSMGSQRLRHDWVTFTFSMEMKDRTKCAESELEDEL